LAEYISIKNWSEDDKPREKLAANGRETLSNAELLGILLGNGTRSKSAVDLARDVLNLANNDLNQLAKLSIKDFCQISGIGPAKAITIIAAIELGGRRKRPKAPHNLSVVVMMLTPTSGLFCKIKNTKSFGYFFSIEIIKYLNLRK